NPNSGLPAISGSPAVGSTMTASNGSWSNSPTSYTPYWYDCDSSGRGELCTYISTATTNSYVVTSADVGKALRFALYANNAQGYTWAMSPSTTVVSTGAAAGAACTANSGCASGVCVTGYCCTNGTVTGGTCGATACASGTGTPTYPSTSASCTSQSC